jgi:hypothetical protein
MRRPFWVAVPVAVRVAFWVAIRTATPPVQKTRAQHWFPRSRSAADKVVVQANEQREAARVRVERQTGTAF